METPRRWSTTGQSPPYDLRFRWTQARHNATFDNVALQETGRRPASELPHASSASQRMGTSGFVQVMSRPVCWIIDQSSAVGITRDGR